MGHRQARHGICFGEATQLGFGTCSMESWRGVTMVVFLRLEQSDSEGLLGSLEIVMPGGAARGGGT